jgi:hypothetical protein
MDHVTLSLDEDVEIVVRRRIRRRRASVQFAVPYFTAADEPHGRKRPMAVKIPNDAIGTVPLAFIDLEGHPIAGSVAATVTATLSDPTLATAAITTDGQWVQITPLLAAGAGTVTYHDPDDNLLATLDFSIVTPTPATVSFNEAGMVLTPNPNPPAGAPGGPTVAGGTSTVTGGGTSTVGGGASTVTGGTSTVAGGA